VSFNSEVEMCSVIGLGFVGSALHKSFALKKVSPLGGYDRYKNGGIGSLEQCTESPIIFLCLPTLYDDDRGEYDKSAIKDVVGKLALLKYGGLVVVKSTVEPGTTDELSRVHPSLKLMHNPEFLSAATAFQDFHNQDHIVIGQGKNCCQDDVEELYNFYQKHWPEAELSVCKAVESESMKSFVNVFYSVKIQFFNELYLLCQEQGSDFQTVKKLMLKNKWINPMHTQVPGHDGKLSYGGACFPKDTNALLQHMKKVGTPHQLLEGCVRERNMLRGDKNLNKKLDALDNENNENNGQKSAAKNMKKDLYNRSEIINGNY